MRNFIIFIIAVLTINVSANTLCNNFLVTESSRIILELNNTSHDLMGANDEISLMVSTSSKKLNEDNFFSDFFGAKMYKQTPDFYVRNITDVEAPFNTKTVIADQEIAHDRLFNQYLNLLVVDKDLAVPLASGSIELPFYLATGGNHDDLIFARSIKLNLNNAKGVKFKIKNEIGDEMLVTILPAKVVSMKRNEIIEQLAKVNNSKARSQYLNALLNGQIIDSCNS